MAAKFDGELDQKIEEAFEEARRLFRATNEGKILVASSKGYDRVRNQDMLNCLMIEFVHADQKWRELVDRRAKNI